MKIFRKLDKKRFILLNVLFLFIFIAFLFPQKVFALDIPFILSGLLIPIISGLGKLLATLINLLITVAQYNTFINSAAVSRGWIIIRDICNMFFVIVLLVMAFSTVLNIEKYSVKRLLGSFLIAAILVNFSKLICGVLIDASQILMLTFVKAFSAAAEGNFITMLGLDKILMLNASETISDNEVIGSLILGFIMTVVALVVIGIMTMILVFRIVILWFLVLLSPLAFVTSILPELQKYSGQWWQKFTSQIIVGPVMAFFIWLSLVVVSGNASGTSLLSISADDEKFQTLEQVQEFQDSDKIFTVEEILNMGPTATVSEAGQPQYVLNFIIGIAMLVGSLMVAQQMGVVGSKMAGNAVTKMQAIASGAVKAPFTGLKKTAKFLGAEGVRELEAATKIPLTKSKWKEVLEERATKSKERRDTRWGRTVDKGVLSYIPQGVKGWARVLHLKGGPESVGKFVQGITGKAQRLRAEGAGKQDELEKVGEEIDVKTSKKNYDELNKDIKKNEQDVTKSEENYQGLEKEKEVDLSEIGKFLSQLKIEAKDLDLSGKEPDIKKAKELTPLVNELENIKKNAGEEGKTVVKESDFKKGDIDILTKKGLKLTKKEEINVSEIDGFLDELKQRSDILGQSKKEADGKEAKRIDILVKDIEKVKDKVNTEGGESIKVSDLETENQDLFVNSGLSWAKEEKKIAEINLEDLTKKRDNYTFSEGDQEEAKKNLEGLQGKITELKIDDKAKQELVDNLNSLIKDIDKPFKDLTPEKRKEMANQVWHVQKKIKDFRNEEKIDEEDVESITSLTSKSFSQLSKEVTTEDDMSKKVKSQKDLKEKVLELQADAELIQPRTMSSDQRSAINRGVNREYEELKGVDDGDELKAMYVKAEKDNNISLARACLMKLNDNFDLNELMEDLGLRQNYQGMADFAKRMSKTMDMPIQEAYMFMNDLGATNKLRGRFRFYTPVVRDKASGLYREAKPEEHEEMATIESGKVDREQLYRRGSWGAIFGKEQDPITGIRVPIWDNTTRAIMKRDLGIILAEIGRQRLQPEHERNMCHKISMDGLEKIRPGLIAEDKVKLDRVLRHFKNIQPKYWGAEGKET